MFFEFLNALAFYLNPTKFLTEADISCLGVTSGPNPGGPAEERTLSITYTWAQEPSGLERTAAVSIPTTTAGQKVPVVFHLHGKYNIHIKYVFEKLQWKCLGNGGQGNTIPFANFIGDDAIIVAPNGYERSW